MGWNMVSWRFKVHSIDYSWGWHIFICLFYGVTDLSCEWAPFLFLSDLWRSLSMLKDCEPLFGHLCVLQGLPPTETVFVCLSSSPLGLSHFLRSGIHSPSWSNPHPPTMSSPAILSISVHIYPCSLLSCLGVTRGFQPLSRLLSLSEPLGCSSGQIWDDFTDSPGGIRPRCTSLCPALTTLTCHGSFCSYQRGVGALAGEAWVTHISLPPVPGTEAGTKQVIRVCLWVNGVTNGWLNEIDPSLTPGCRTGSKACSCPLTHHPS